jgi:hypothetical protein
VAGKTLELERLFTQQSLAQDIANAYVTYNNQRQEWLKEKQELRNYIFATDTRTTSNSKLPWKNSTHLPKLAQIRDNLHSNYLSALFPNDDWLTWEGYTEDAEEEKKTKAILGYMDNKLRMSGFRQEVSKLIYDYIDFGNVFGEVVFVKESKIDPETQEEIPGYIGPKLLRRSPIDLVINPTAAEFRDTPKITRILKNFGELELDLESQPENSHYQEILENMRAVRNSVSQYDISDTQKFESYQLDGFGSLTEYYQSGLVEILEFEGTIYDRYSRKLLKDYRITVYDRAWIARQEPNPSWLGESSKVHCGWRLRPDNLYAMGPLDNLVGMQYRINHLENLKADAMDLAVMPPVFIKGDVEQFDWEPLAEIIGGEDAEIHELGKNLSAVIAADNQIAELENKMEEMAGAPKTAMGFRTPGEKTAYEVQSLDNAASRIFQEKITNFELNVIEPLLNKFLEVARRNMDGSDLIRTMDNDLGVSDFIKITKEDITAAGKLRPIGARHFAATAQLVQNLSGSLNVAQGIQGVLNHVSGKKLAHILFEEIPGLRKFDLVQDNISIIEQAQTQRLINTAAQSIQGEQMTSMDQGADLGPVDQNAPAGTPNA